MENKLGFLRCQSCGSYLQVRDHKIPGFIDERSLNKKIPNLCKRCFQLLNYKIVTPLNINSNKFENLIRSIPEQVSIVAITDIFNITQQFVDFLKIFKNRQIIVVINKIEVLPRDYKIRKIVDWLRDVANEEGVKISYIVPVSAKNKYNIDILFEILNKDVAHSNIYFIGNANVGKSSVINALIASYNNKFIKPGISALPGTTLDLIKFQVHDKNWFDTPGILLANQEIDFLSFDDWQMILPKNKLKSRNYQLNPNQSIFIGGLGWLDVLGNNKTTLIFYFSDNVLLHRRKSVDAVDFYQQQLGKMLVPPKKEFDIGDTLKFKRLTTTQKEKVDLVVPGIGWVSLSTGSVVQSNFRDKVNVSYRKAIV